MGSEKKTRIETGDESSSSVEWTSKRAREGEGEDEEMFQKSKKTIRSPVKVYKMTEEKIDKLLVMMQEMKLEMAGMRREQRESNEELRALKQESEKLREDYAVVRRENEEMKQELAKLQGITERLERESRRKNVIVAGIPIDTADPQEVKQCVESFIEQNLEIKIQVKSAHKLGGKMCLIELADLKEKEEIMKNKHRLKNLRGQRVYINDDLTEGEREVQKQIRLRAREERGGGKKVKVGYNRLIIEDEEWRWNRNGNKLERVKN